MSLRNHGVGGGAKCPVCLRSDGIDQVERALSAPFETRYHCNCGCKWVSPPRFQPLTPTPKPHEETCVKCGAGNPMLQIADGELRLQEYMGRPVYMKGVNEALLITCSSCGYAWCRPTLDAKASPSKPQDEHYLEYVFPSWTTLKKHLDERDAKLKAEMIEHFARNGVQ